MKLMKKILLYILLFALCVYLGSCAKSCHDYVTYKNIFEYKLSDFGNGIYGYYNAVTSNIPAENYEMIVLCFAGRIHTLNGDVNIHYTDGEPKLIWTDVNVVHGDTFEVYVPYGSIEMRPNLVQS